MVSILRFDARAIDRAARVILKGGLVAYATDTVYGLGCDPRNEVTVRRLFEVKGRKKRPVPVLCANMARSSELVELGGIALKLATKYWPGPLTLVLPLKASLPSQLHQGSGWLGVRVPAHPGCRTLLESVGGWLTGTSANLSGQPSCRSPEDVLRQLGDSVDLILDGGTLGGTESTVVKVEGNDVEVLRRGAVSLDLGVVRGGYTAEPSLDFGKGPRGESIS